MSKVTQEQVVRADAILHEYLPVIRGHEQAIDHLFFVAAGQSRVWAIAAALFILKEFRADQEARSTQQTFPTAASRHVDAYGPDVSSGRGKATMTQVKA